MRAVQNDMFARFHSEKIPYLKNLLLLITDSLKPNIKDDVI